MLNVFIICMHRKLRSVTHENETTVIVAFEHKGS